MLSALHKETHIFVTINFQLNAMFHLNHVLHVDVISSHLFVYIFPYPIRAMLSRSIFDIEVTSLRWTSLNLIESMLFIRDTLFWCTISTSTFVNRMAFSVNGQTSYFPMFIRLHKNSFRLELNRTLAIEWVSEFIYIY